MTWINAMIYELWYQTKDNFWHRDNICYSLDEAMNEIKKRSNESIKDWLVKDVSSRSHKYYKKSSLYDMKGKNND